MLNKGQKIAIVIGSIGILMILSGAIIEIVNKVQESTCMNMPFSEAYNSKQCQKYIDEYIKRWTDEW